MGALQKLASQTALYGISSIVGRLLNYFMVPLYTAVLALESNGIITGLYTYIAFLNVLCTFGLETAYFRFVTKNPEKAKETFSTAILLVAVISALIGIGISFAAPYFARQAHIPQNPEIIRYVALLLVIDSVAQIPFAYLRLQGNAKKFVAAKMLNIIALVALNISFLVLWPIIFDGVTPNSHSLYSYWEGQGIAGVSAVILANLLANALLPLLLIKEFGQFNFKINFSGIRPMLAYAYPIMLIGLAATVNDALGRNILDKILPDNYYPGITSEAALGIYGNCYKLSVFMMLAIQAFRYAAEPFFFSQAAAVNSRLVLANVMKWFVIACLLLFLAVSFNLDLIGSIFLRRKEYAQGFIVVPYLLMANLFLGVYYNLTVWFKLTDRTIYGTYLSIGGALVTVALNFLLIPIFGYLGSALTTLVCYMVMATACYILGQKYYPVPYATGRILGYIAFAVILLVSFNILPIHSVYIKTLVSVPAILLFVAITLLAEKETLPPRLLKILHLTNGKTT